MNRIQRAGVGLILLTGLGAGLSCGGGSDGATGPGGPDPGPVSVVLVTANADDGGLLLTVSGGAVTSLASGGYEYTGTVSGTGAQALIRGNLTDGPVLTLTLPDRKQLDRYRVQLQQVAARAPTYQQRPPTGYQLTLSRP